MHSLSSPLSTTLPPLYLPACVSCFDDSCWDITVAHLNSVQNCALDGVQTSCTARICIVLPHFISHVLSCLCAQMLGRFSVSNGEHWQGIMVGPCLWCFFGFVIKYFEYHMVIYCVYSLHHLNIAHVLYTRSRHAGLWSSSVKIWRDEELACENIPFAQLLHNFSLSSEMTLIIHFVTYIRIVLVSIMHPGSSKMLSAPRYVGGLNKILKTF